MDCSSSSSSSSSPPSRVAVVTGANKGIGFFIALELGLSGLFSSVILGCRDAHRGLAAVEEMTKIMLSSSEETCTDMGFNFLPLTIGDENSHDEFYRRMDAEFGKVDVLVNNAGIGFGRSDPTPFQEQTNKTLQTNYFGLVDFTDKMMPLLRKGDDPRLVNVASVRGRRRQVSAARQRQFTNETLAIPELNKLMEEFADDRRRGDHREKGWSDSNYGMSKLGVIAATRVWARREPAIKVNSCCPGHCATDKTNYRGKRLPEDGAVNAIIPATMESPPTGVFFEHYRIANW